MNFRASTEYMYHLLPLSCCREDSPESFHHELENIAWEESLRGCTENTFLALFEVRQGGGRLEPKQQQHAAIASVFCQQWPGLFI
jgi:hypothetical protein